ncbi:hypothetical protein D9M69_610200 [compost metagenome]
MHSNRSQIAFKESHLSAKCAQFINDSLITFTVGNRQIKPFSGQSTRYAKPDPAPPASHQCHRSLTVHASTSRFK